MFLSSLARDVLVVPISTNAYEFPFSIGGRVLDAYRSYLTTKIVQTLICSQDWILSELKSSILCIIEDHIGQVDNFTKGEIQ